MKLRTIIYINEKNNNNKIFIIKYKVKIIFFLKNPFSFINIIILYIQTF